MSDADFRSSLIPPEVMVEMQAAINRMAARASLAYRDSPGAKIVVDPQRVYSVVPISREQAVDWGEPRTPDEQSRHDAWMAAWKERRARAHQAILEWETYIAAVTDPLSRKVLDLHSCSKSNTCEGCDYQGYEADPIDWPCATVCLVMAHLGWPVPDNYEDAR